MTQKTQSFGMECGDGELASVSFGRKWWYRLLPFLLAGFRPSLAERWPVTYMKARYVHSNGSLVCGESWIPEIEKR